MEKEFVPYEQALALKELGFDEPCIKYYWTDGMLTKTYGSPFNYNKINNLISAPLYQQAFRWFRENYEIDSWVFKNLNIKYSVSIIKNKKAIGNLSQYNDYKEAELQCLKKLIEIVKNIIKY